MNALVVGYGRMGGFHRKVLCDLGYDVETVDPVVHADHAEVPHTDFDVVCVATPISHLAPEAAKWKGFRGKLLVEKPFAVDVLQADWLAGELEGVDVAVGYVDRFNPAVRALREWLDGRQDVSARFIRYSDRPTSDMLVDLRTHDVDLARWLGVRNPLFDTQANVRTRRREIAAIDGGAIHVANLLAHDTSPLHAQWHHFLGGGTEHAKPQDAVGVLRDVMQGVLAA